MKTIILLILLLASVIIADAQTPWTQKADMPTAKFGHSSVMLDGKIYVIGGSSSASTTLSTLEIYDPVLDTWISKAPMPEKKTDFYACEVNGKIYAVGGGEKWDIGALDAILEYDPITDTWTYKTEMPRPRIGLTSSVINSKIYIIGGADVNENPYAEVDVYDVQTNTWSMKTNIPTPRMNMQAIVINNKIYTIGGQVSSPWNAYRTVEMYDPETDTWTTKTGMITRRKYFSAAAVNGKIYAFGGAECHCQEELQSVEEYDPETDTWTMRDNFPYVLAGASAVSCNGKIYIIGGTITAPPVTVIPTMMEYDPHLDLLPLIEKTEINKGYVKPGTDSVWITMKMKEITGITLLAEINTPDQIPVDSLQLFDDGKHNDGIAGDSLYANVWKVGYPEEQQYDIDLIITRIGTDTVVYQMNNIAAFTTIGPVGYDGYSFTGDDTEPNPGDRLNLELTLKNKGLAATATNITTRLTTGDDLVYLTDHSRSFDDIPAGGSATSTSTYSIRIYDEHPGKSDIPIVAHISSNGFVFWTDTFSIEVPDLIRNPSESMVRVYPNPVNDKLIIEIDNISTKTSITLYDITGKVVYSENLESTPLNHTINLSSLRKGLYLITISNEQNSYTEKVIKVE